ncbi:hypothetical protein O1611_g6543 [Lasiodiplodia mahajangana]|uniref:Uncharacterized protein n=1 Tax=Lasiodiplodia mahajangana TaxID=1108764 RepID=A0ACC2JI83_9PEZI|nr:hypothetical protein O1611_g6543 [Lasiodiplodia mahajangana]
MDGYDQRRTSLNCLRNSEAKAVWAASDELPSKVSASSGSKKVLELSASSRSEVETPRFLRLDAAGDGLSILEADTRNVLVPCASPYWLVPELGGVGVSTPEVDRAETNCWRRFSMPARRSSIWSILRSLFAGGDAG